LSFNEDFEKYKEKSGDISDGLALVPIFRTNEHGFITMSVEKDILFVHQCYGDGQYWDDFAVQYAKDKGLTKIRFFTFRSARAWERKFGYKQIGVIMQKDLEV